MPFAPRYENLAVKSFILWLNNYILSEGAYTNVNSEAYKISQTHNGYTTYSFPFNQLVADFSVPNAQIPTGVYVNGVFTTKGSNGLIDINYDKGQVYFSSAPTGAVSGHYAVKDLNISTNSFPDLKLLLETKMELRPKTSVNQPVTGIKNDELSYPVIFIKNMGGFNEPFEFGGVDLTNTNISCFIFSNSQFLLDGVNGLLKDAKYKFVPIFQTGEFPYNNLGGFANNVNFNYTGVTNGKIGSGQAIWIKDVTISDISRRSLFQEAKAAGTDVYISIADFELCRDRLT